MQVVYVLLGLFGTGLLIVIAGVFAYLSYRKNKSVDRLTDAMTALRESFEKSAAAPDKLSDVVEKLLPIAKDMSKVPEFINGHAKAAGAIAMQVAKLQQTISTFASVIVDPSAQKQALSYAREEDASLAFEIGQVLAENPSLSMQAARDAAAQQLEQKAALPQISME